MMKNRSIRILTIMAAVAALATVIGCSKNDKDDAPSKPPAPAAEKVPAQTDPETVVSAETKTDAKLLALKFHHDD